MSDKKILMKNNNLVNAQYDITLNMNKLFTYLLYKFQRERENELVHTVTKSELSELIGRTNDASVDGLSRQLEELRMKNLRLLDVKSDGSYEYMSYGFINGFVYNNATDCFVITAEKKVHNLLHKYLDDGYTPINLVVWLSLKNKYAQRLYDLLRAWSGIKDVVTYEVDKLRSLMALGKKYKQYADFRKRVLIPAIDELNESGCFEIDYKENKTGRKVTSIDFYVKDLDDRIYFSKNAKIVKEIQESCMTEENAFIYDKNENVTNVEVARNLKQTSKTDDLIRQNDKVSFYIPDEEIFTKGTLRRFKMDFKEIDFYNEYMNSAFEDAVMITFDRDDVESIAATSYKFFKGCLDNKIIEYKKEEEEDLQNQIENDLLW